MNAIDNQDKQLKLYNTTENAVKLEWDTMKCCKFIISQQILLLKMEISRINTVIAHKLLV